MSCDHKRTASKVVIFRQDNPKGMPTHYRAEIEIKCMDCGIPFKLLMPDDSVKIRPSPSTAIEKATVQIIPGDWLPFGEGNIQNIQSGLPSGMMNERKP